MKHRSEVDIFNDQWHCYRWMVDNNIMGHQQLMQLAAGKLRDYFTNKKVRLLDLGCGDASVTAEMTRELPLSSYTAVDLVDSVLKMAEENMTRPGVKTLFKQSNIFAPLPVEGYYNLMFSSYAIHHGSLEEKQALFSEMRTKAEPGCLFLMIDAILPKDLNREQYLKSVNRYFKSLPDLNKEWLNFVLDHVNQFDFPESIEQFEHIGKQSQWHLMEHHLLEGLPDYPAGLLVFQAQ
ncbi:class I SAM-dependent methyltransferase [Endozoicomonas arenosclerae]|uniref:class I SAM-dependent methyltransferase n=1 Tax=Endozoicomonas arenosclerae TaxID=1633495 RepID=UPI0015602444|nr:class I SAM-dependent methyltransferase [Endozoicomonas arenosclerae]